MPLVGITDINVYLPEDKLVIYNADDDAPLRDAERIIKARLSGTFAPATLASWSIPGNLGDTPAPNVPQKIQQIAGKLVASLVYAKAFSSEIVGVPEYAQKLYDDAMADLDAIVIGDIILPPDEVPGETVDTGSRLTSDMFWPNDDTTGARFRMSDQF